MAGKFDISDYVQVGDRIMAFHEKYPEGSLQSEIVRYDDDLVIIKAYAYRTIADPRPGIGHSSLTIPGTTPYTRGAELENAETSAWGRALAALGFEVKRGIASQDEVEAKRGQSNEPPIEKPSRKPATAVAAFVQEASAWLRENGLSWIHPMVIAELGVKPTPDTIAEVANRWLVDNRGSIQLFKSRIGDRINYPEASDVLEAQEAQE